MNWVHVADYIALLSRRICLRICEVDVRLAADCRELVQDRLTGVANVSRSLIVLCALVDGQKNHSEHSCTHI